MMKRKLVVAATTTTSAGDEMAAWRHIYSIPPPLFLYFVFFLPKMRCQKTCKLAFRDSAHLGEKARASDRSTAAAAALRWRPLTFIIIIITIIILYI